MPIDPALVKALFLELAAIDEPTERAARLRERCGADSELLARVNALLAANDRAVMSEGTGTFSSDPIGNSEARTADFPGRDEQIGAILAGKYKLMEEIGEGGMGSVYMALQTEPVKRAVAVKVIKAGMDSKAVLARFEAERQALAMMDHPNIARVLDAGTTESGRPFFVMELVKGLPITQYCDEQKLTPRRRLELFIPVCQAIQHAHQKGVIHRDIKPSNVLIALYDDRPVPKVIDFGVSKAAGQSLTDKTLMTGFGAVVGTPEYMSPEQASLNNLDVDTRSDVYSLGVLLYELLTGTTPVDRKSLGRAAVLEVLRIVREEEPPRPSAKLSTIDALASVAANRGTEPAKLSKLLKGELDWVVLKALEKNRARRYDTANGLARDIQRYLADEIVEARPQSTGYRIRKFVKRHRGQVVAAGLVLFALVAGIAGTTVGLIRAENRRVEAESARIEAERARANEAEQREAAGRNERAAIEERKIADAINQFFQNDILRQADARFQAERSANVNPNLTVREALDRASERIGHRFRGQPLIEASIRTAIAEGYLGIGDAEKAIRHLERSRSILAAQRGEEHYETLACRRRLVGAYVMANRPADARTLGEETLSLLRSRYGASDPQALMLMNLLGMAHLDLRAPKKALELYEELLRIDTSRRGAEHADVLTVMNNLAIAYERVGRMDEARALHESSLEKRRTTLGPGHPDTLMTMNNLGTLYWRTGRLDRSIPLFEEAVRLRELKIGADHPYAIRSLANLGINYRDAGRLPEAIAALEEAVRLGRQRTGPDVVNHFQTVQILAEVYTDVSDHQKAEPLFRYLLDTASRKLGPQSTAAASWSARLGLNLLSQNRADEAEPLIRASLAVRQRQEPEAWTTFNTRSLLGGVLMSQHKYAEAEPLLLAGYRGMKQREAKIPKDGVVRLTESIDRLVGLYTAMNKSDEVKKWRAERTKYPEVAPPPREKK
jgi:eukaryotic-like serine/threonine-protein kinase